MTRLIRVRQLASLARQTRGFRTSITALSNKNDALKLAFKSDEEDDKKRRYQASNPEVPVLMALEKRWHKMDAVDQDNIVQYLADKSRGDWHDLTAEEKKAIWFVNYGPYGPRSTEPDDPGRIYSNFAKAIAGIIIGISAYKGYQHSTKDSD